MTIRNARPGQWAHEVPDDDGPIVLAVTTVSPTGEPTTTPSGGTPVAGHGVTPVNRSGTIAAGGTAQQLAAANPDRQGFWIQNLSAEDLWINDLGAATTGQPSWKIPPDALYEAPITGVTLGALSIIGATTGQAFAAREW